MATNDRSAGSSVEPCPLKDCSIVVQVRRTDTNDVVPDIKIVIDGPTKDNKKSDAGTGKATFDPVDPGAYSIEAVLDDKTQEEFEPPEKAAGSVGRGSELARILWLTPLAILKVKVFFPGDEEYPEELIGDADITVRGGVKNPKLQTAKDTGIADFGRTRSGEYRISTNLTGLPARIYYRPHNRAAFLKPGQELLVPIPLQRCPEDLDIDFSDDVEPGGELLVSSKVEPSALLDFTSEPAPSPNLRASSKIQPNTLGIIESKIDAAPKLQVSTQVLAAKTNQPSHPE